MSPPNAPSPPSTSSSSRQSRPRSAVVDAGVGPLVCDGSLLARPQSPLLNGVVKSTRTKYYKDETVLYGMPQGWRSPIFRIPSGSDGCPVDRYSCYVRLHDARFHAWTHGLIRLETFDPAQLEPLAARALVERRSASSGDGRWDRHLLSVATTEKVLRSRRPDVFDI